MTTSSLDKSIDLRHYVKILWRRKGLLFLSTVTVVCAASIALTFMPKEYESSVTFHFDERLTLTRDLQQVVGAPSGMSYDADRSRFVSVMARIRSEPFLEKVVRSLKMAEDPRVRDAARQNHATHPEMSVDQIATRLVVKSLQSRIRFGSGGMGIYEVIVTDYDPMTAYRLADWISQYFLDEMARIANEQMERASEFAIERIPVYEEQLRQAKEDFESYSGSRIRIQQDLTSGTVQAENLQAASMLLRLVRQEAEGAKMQVGPYARQLAQSDLPTGAAEALQGEAQTVALFQGLQSTLQTEKDNLLAQLAAPGATFDPRLWPPGGQYPEQRTELVKHLKATARERYPQAFADAIDQLANVVFYRGVARLQDDLAHDLDQSIQTYKNQERSRPGEELELRRRQLEVQRAEQRLELFKTQEYSTAITKAIENARLGEQIEVLNPPQVPLAPSRPNRLKVLLAALLLGPLLGAGFAFVGETMDSTLRTLEDIKKVAPEPILCTTPLLSKLSARPRGLRRYWLPAAVTGVVVLTALFLAVRLTVLREALAVGQSIQTVEPNAAEAEGN